jgi:phosphoacetylglucosamine mutase
MNVITCGLQLINEFVEKERIPFDGFRPTEILLGRDTRPSGEALLEAARQVWAP